MPFTVPVYLAQVPGVVPLPAVKTYPGWQEVQLVADPEQLAQKETVASQVKHDAAAVAPATL